jgi:hypothetical protein
MEKYHVGREHVQHRQHVRRLKAVLADVAPVSYLGAIRKVSITRRALLVGVPAVFLNAMFPLWGSGYTGSQIRVLYFGDVPEAGVIEISEEAFERESGISVNVDPPGLRKYSSAH